MSLAIPEIIDSSSPPAAVPRLVIDTNVWLDLLVFDDPRTRVLGTCLAQRRVRALALPAMLDELALVLDYHHIRPRVADPDALLHRINPWVDRLPEQAIPVSALPSCRDPDDQKFLEAAWIGQARWLVSKDKAVLRLARKIRTFQIVAPSAALDGALMTLP